MEATEHIVLWDGQVRDQVQIELPYAKSIQNRILMLTHLYPNQVEGSIIPDSDDVRLLQNALLQQSDRVDFGMAGTSARFFTACACAMGWEGIIDGSGRGRERPLAPLIEALRSLGATIEELGEIGQFPIRVSGSGLRGGSVKVDSTQSSQFASALMMIGPKLKGGLTLYTGPEPASAPYLELTAQLMRSAGFDIGAFEAGYQIQEAPASPSVRFVLSPERDWSSVVYFVQALVLGCCNALEFLGLSAQGTQPDQALLSLIETLGVEAAASDGGWAFQRIRPPRTDQKFRTDASAWPDLAVGMAHMYQAVGMPVVLCGLHTLDLKESQRLHALHARLSLHGRAATTNPGVLELENGSVRPDRLHFDSLGDHRLAMGCAAWARFGPLRLVGAGTVSKSFPGFWTEFQRLGFDLTSGHPTVSE
ncbi:hypothetical protein GC167_08130 [bacterium]|nr:hypothetical protein [bacterium]